jgi:choline-sulfatase
VPRRAGLHPTAHSPRRGGPGLKTGPYRSFWGGGLRESGRRTRTTWRGRATALIIAAVLSLASCSHADQSHAPSSIILITIDTLRADHVNDRLTPALAALSREAIVFDNAVTSAPLTVPAHASLLTAAYPPRHQVHDNHVYALGADVPTFPARLKERGYATAAFVGAIVLDHRYGLNRGFDVYDDRIPGPERSAAETVALAERWIAAAARPFFIWIHLFEPHAPYRTGSYEGDVGAADTALDALFGFLRGRGLWDEAVVSVTSDHGEALGDHGEQTHGFFVYDATMRIPWILKAPGVGARHFRPLVRIVDELPTVVELAHAGVQGRGSDGARAMDGVDLTPFVSKNKSPALEAYGETFLPRDQFGWSELRSIQTERSKFIQAPQPEFYDLTVDPGERANTLAARAGDASVLERALTAIARTAAPASPRAAVAPDPLLAEKLMSLGYIGFSPSLESKGAGLADPKAKLEVYNLIMSALELSEAGNVTAALDKLQHAEQLDRGVAQIAFLQGNMFGRVGRFAEAVRALERTLALNPQFVGARFKLALALLRIGEADRAASALERVVQDQPDDFRAWHNLAAVAYSRGDVDRAEQLERKALAINREYAEAWNTLGAIYIVRRQPAAAVDALNVATRLAPRNAQAFHNLSLALRAVDLPEPARSAAAMACSIDQQYCRSSGRR